MLAATDKMTGKPFGLLWIALVASCWFTACGGETRAVPDLNVLLISYDTLRADRLGLYGYEVRETSPHLDALSRRAVVFEQAIAQASSTFPSHLSLFQSRYASQLSRSAPVLAELLQRAGLRTAAFTNAGNVSERVGFDAGFGSFYETRSLSGLSELMPRFEKFLREHSAEPFFVFLHTYDIHLPYDPPKPFQDAFTAGYTGSLTGAQTGPVMREAWRPTSGGEPDVELDDEDRAHVSALYDAGIRYADSYLPRIDALLQELDLWRNTLVVFFSDHGEEFWDHGDVLHSTTVYQESVHVPLIIWFPGGRGAGTRVFRTVPLLDVTPTILEVLGLRRPKSVQGRSLLPLLDGTDRPRPAVSEIHQLKAWIDFPHKLIVDRGPGALHLYRLDRDPSESNDLAKSDPEGARALYRRLAETLGPDMATAVRGVPKIRAEKDRELLEQLRALGYVD